VYQTWPSMSCLMVTVPVPSTMPAVTTSPAAAAYMGVPAGAA